MPMDPELAALRARIAEVLRLRDLSRVGLSRLAGLGGPHISMLLRGKIGAGIQQATIDKIADAARVRRAWLAHGDLPRDLAGEERPRDKAVRIARELGYAEAWIAPALDVPIAGEEPGVNFWFDWIYKVRADAHAESPPAADPTRINPEPRRGRRR